MLFLKYFFGHEICILIEWNRVLCNVATTTTVYQKGGLMIRFEGRRARVATLVV